jgi:hypothetical protein
MNRWDCVPLHEASAIHAVLVGLFTHDVVPPEIYISDYENGEVPQWEVVEREEHGILTILTLIDKIQPLAGVEVFACATKILAGPHYRYSPGCVKARNPLCDIRQNARQMADRMKAGKAPHAGHRQKGRIVKDTPATTPTNLQLWEVS